MQIQSKDSQTAHVVEWQCRTLVQCALCARLSLLLYRDGPTMVSTCNKLQEPDDVTLGAVVGNTCCSCVSIVLVHACIRVVGERENVQDKAVSSSRCRSF